MKSLWRPLIGMFLCAASLLIPFSATAAAKYRIVIMPKLVGIGYYDAVKQGIDAAAKELPDVEVTWTGPTQDQVEKQIDMIEQLIPTHPDVIAVAANDPVAIVPVLEKAQQAGIHVISWDGDTRQREFFVNLVNFTDFGNQLVEALHEQIGNRGEIAIITTSFTAPNQSSWISAIKKHLYAKYPNIKIVDTRPAGESMEEAYRITQDYLKTYPQLKGIIALGAPNLPGAAKALKEAGAIPRVALIGNSTPNLMRDYLKEGSVKKVLLWNAPDHGYLTVYSAYQLLTHGLQSGVPFKAGRLGAFTPQKDELSMQIALPVMIFTKENVDKFHF